MNSAAPWQTRQQSSGRAGEFRMDGGQLQRLEPDGTWAPYVPFERLKRRQLKQRLGAIPCDCDKYRGSERAFADGTLWTCPRCGERYQSDDGAWLRVAADPEQQMQQIWREVADLAPPLPAPDLTILHQPEPPPSPPLPAEHFDHQEDATMTTTQERHGHSSRQRYTDEFKAAILEELATADNKKDLARDRGLSYPMVMRWQKEAGKTGPKPAKAEKIRSAPAKKPPPTTSPASSMSCASCSSCPRPPATGSSGISPTGACDLYNVEAPQPGGRHGPDPSHDREPRPRHPRRSRIGRRGRPARPHHAVLRLRPSARAPSARLALVREPGQRRSPRPSRATRSGRWRCASSSRRRTPPSGPGSRSRRPPWCEPSSSA